MPNVKEVQISGWLPFDAGATEDVEAQAEGRSGSGASDELLKMLGQISLPTIGIKVEYTGAERMVPNRWGGQTAMVRFELSGQEAVSADFIRHFVGLVTKVGGQIDSAGYRDIEVGGQWVTLLALRG